MKKVIALPLPVVYIIKTLTEKGYDAFIIGGAVRDLLLDKLPVIDWDFTTNATPEQVQALFPGSVYDNDFGTVMVAVKHVVTDPQIIEELEYLDVFDITTYRSEQGYTNRRHPDTVTWGTSLAEDTKRRDFTINALALEVAIPEHIAPTTFIDAEVTLYDHQQGLADLNAGIVRTVGAADSRFQEDALRMMRAIRLGAQLSFQIEAQTLQAVQSQAHLIQDISQERISVELFKILASNFPADGVLMLFHSGLLEHILPELIETIGVAQGGRHQYDVWKHSLESLRECPSKDPLVRFATLLHDIGKPKTAIAQGPRGVTFYGHEVVGAHMCNHIADRLRLSKKQKQKLFILVRWHMFTYDSNMTDAGIRRFIRRVGVDNINDMILLRIGDRKGGGSKATSWRLRELQERIGENLYEPLGLKDLKINGNDLMTEFELKPGPILGKILNQLFEEVMEDKVVNERYTLLSRAKELASQLG